jgi:hypothetical protein
MTVSFQSLVSRYDFKIFLIILLLQPVTRSQSAKATSVLVAVKNNGEQVLAVTKPEPERRFTLFRTLPLELRLMIWKHAAEPRMIKFSHYGVGWLRELDKDKDPTGELRRKNREKHRRISSSCRTRAAKHKVPNILITCKESREAAQERYCLCFEKELDGQKIWIDFSRDTIFFENFYAFSAFYGNEQPWKILSERPHGKFNNLPRDTTIMEKELQFLITGNVLGKETFDVLSRFQSLQKVILQEGSGYDVEQLKADLMARWSKLERLPQLEQWGRNDLHAKYCSEPGDDVSLISLHSPNNGLCDHRSRMTRIKSRQNTFPKRLSNASENSRETTE